MRKFKIKKTLRSWFLLNLILIGSTWLAWISGQVHNDFEASPGAISPGWISLIMLAVSSYALKHRWVMSIPNVFISTDFHTKVRRSPIYKGFLYMSIGWLTLTLAAAGEPTTSADHICWLRVSWVALTLLTLPVWAICKYWNSEIREEQKFAKN